MNNFFELYDISYDRGYFTNNSYVKELIAKTETNFPELHKILSNNSRGRGEQKLEIKRLGPPLAVPLTGGLRSIADRYLLKYGIEIKVISFDLKNAPSQLLASALEKELQDSTPRTIGIIFEEEGKTSHVVPLLLKVEKEPKILVLDVIGDTSHEFNYLVLEVLHSLKIPFSRCKNKTQADNRSCRIHAPIALRNALLTLKENQESALKPFESCRVHDSLTLLDSVFELPPEWGGATNQIFHPQANVDHVLNPRQKYSKVKGKHIETIQESRLRHRITACFKIHYTLPPSPLTEDIDLNSFNLPPGVKIIKYRDGTWRVTWLVKREINGYMLNKGHKEAKLEAAKNQEKNDLAFALWLSNNLSEQDKIAKKRQEDEDSKLARREGLVYGIENSLVTGWETTVTLLSSLFKKEESEPVLKTNVFETHAFACMIEFIEQYGFTWMPDGLYFLNAGAGLVIAGDDIKDILLRSIGASADRLDDIYNRSQPSSQETIFEAIRQHIAKISQG